MTIDDPQTGHAAATLQRRVIATAGTDLACWHRPGNGRRWVLWLHGAAGNHLMWSQQFDQLPGDDLLFLDLRGQGESTMHAGRRADLDGATGDIGAVLDAYGVDSAVLVGSSWGGNPAQEYALAHPERVAGLVLVGTWGQHRPVRRGEVGAIRAMTLAYRVLPWRVAAWYCGRACSADPAVRATIAAAVRATGRQVYLDLGLSGYEAVREVDPYPVATPTLLVRGEHDSPAALDAIFAYLGERNPSAQVVVIPGTGHVPMLDAPAEFNHVLRAFLDNLSARTGSRGEPG